MPIRGGTRVVYQSFIVRTLCVVLVASFGMLPKETEGSWATPSSLKVAFFGDQGTSTAVLELINREKADAAFALGDFDYQHDPDGWDGRITAVLWADFPVFGVIGNHDITKWPQYKQKLEERLAKVPGARCDGDYGVKAVCNYASLFFVLSGAGTLDMGHTEFIQEKLQDNGGAICRICAWHKNQQAMQVGAKEDEVGWGPYEACLAEGAIIATAQRAYLPPHEDLDQHRDSDCRPGLT